MLTRHFPRIIRISLIRYENFKCTGILFLWCHFKHHRNKEIFLSKMGTHQIQLCFQKPPNNKMSEFYNTYIDDHLDKKTFECRL